MHKLWSSLGNSINLIICWGNSTAGHKQSRRFLDCTVDNFLLQVIEEPIRGGAMLDHLPARRNVNLKGRLGYSDHEKVKFQILRAVRRVHSKITILDFRRANFGLFRVLLVRVAWDKVLGGRGAQESWLMFEGHLIQAQE